MRTKEKLAAALREAELPAMAGKAAQGYYDDFESELESPALQLIADLREAGTLPALGLLARAVAGEFDATLEEAEAWAATPEGRRLMEESREKSESRDGKGSVGRGALGREVCAHAVVGRRGRSAPLAWRPAMARCAGPASWTRPSSRHAPG